MCAEARLKSGTGSLAPEYDNLSAVIAAGVHLFPFRTEKLSPPAPMVLGGQPPGRVGRRRITFRLGVPDSGPFFIPLRSRDGAARRRAAATAADGRRRAGGGRRLSGRGALAFHSRLSKAVPRV